MQIELSIEQADLLVDILGEKRHSLSIEISHTSHREFRQALKHQESVLESLLENVNAARASIAA